MLKTKEEIENYMGRFGGMDDWTINEKLEVDVPGNTRLHPSFVLNGEFPFQFGTVDGWFDCSNCGLKSLIGAPHTVRGDFGCSNNQLVSLEGAPRYVGGYFNCKKNPVSTIGPIETRIFTVFIGPKVPELTSVATQNPYLDSLSMAVDAESFNSKITELKRVREEKALLEAQLAKLGEPYDREKEGPLPSEKTNKPKNET
jgi:hypothetical protein